MNSSQQRVSDTFFGEFLRHLLGEDGSLALKNWRGLTFFAVFQPVLAIVSDICTVAGTPLAGFSKWMLLACVALVVIFGALAVIRPKDRRGRYATMVVIFFTSMVVSGVVFFAQKALANGTSVIATEIPGVQALRASILNSIENLQADLVHVRQTTDRTAELLESVQKTQLQVARAHLSVSQQFNVTKTDADGISSFDFQAIFKNSGQTAAENVRFDGGELVIPNGGKMDSLAFNFADGFCEGDEMKKKPQTSIGAGEQAHFSLRKIEIVKGISDSTFQVRAVEHFSGIWENLFLHQSAAVLLHGIVCYSDALGKKHYTKFCRYFADIRDFYALSASLCSYDGETD